MLGDLFQGCHHGVLPKEHGNDIDLLRIFDPGIALQSAACLQINPTALGQVDVMLSLVKHGSHQYGAAQHILCGEIANVQVIGILQKHCPHHGDAFPGGLIAGTVQIRQHSVTGLIDLQECLLGGFRIDPRLSGGGLAVASAQGTHQAHLHRADVILIIRNHTLARVIAVIEAADVKAPERNAADAHAQAAVENGVEIVLGSGRVSRPVRGVILAARVTAAAPEKRLLAHLFFCLTGCLVDGLGIQQGVLIVALQTR